MKEIMSTQGLSPSKQAICFQNLIKQGFFDCDASVEPVNGTYAAELEIVKLGELDILKYHGAGIQKAQRRSGHIRRDSSEDLLLYLPLTAVVDIEHSGTQCRLSPGHFSFINTAYPFSGIISADNQPTYSAFVIKLPSTRVRKHLPVIDRYRNTPFELRGGSGRIMMSFLESLIEEAHLVEEAEAPLLEDSLVNLIVSTAHQAIYGHNKQLTGGSAPSKKATHDEIVSFIESNLSNPNLHTTYIAEQCGISLRYLHALFENTSYTVCSWIREQRLEKCREVLQNPEAASLSILEIAMSWGFNEGSHFTRCYKSRFGISPSIDRVRTK